MKENWFKIIIIVLVIVAIFYIPHSLQKKDIRTEAFKICMANLGLEKTDYDGLKLNFQVCNTLSKEFN